MKEVKFNLTGSAISAQLGSKVTKEDLYGDVRKIVEKDGRRLERGYLLPEGVVVRRSQVSSVAIDPEGTAIESLVVTFDGAVVEQAASSFDKESECRPVPLTRLVELNVSDVYELDPGPLEPGLYETCFNYRKTFQPKDALILVKPAEAWLLIGSFKKTTFVGKSMAYEFFDTSAEQEETDPLDFSMM